MHIFYLPYIFFTSVVSHSLLCRSADLAFPSTGSIKGRRSSYLLAITTERSKSCDEGLNTFRDEGRVFSWVGCSGVSHELRNIPTLSPHALVFLSLLYSKLPKRVKSFFTDGVSPHALSLLLPPLLQRLENSPFPPFKPVLAVPGEPAGPGRGPVQAPLHLRTGNHHLQRRTQGGLAALQADPHREGKGTTLQRTCSLHGRRWVMVTEADDSLWWPLRGRARGTGSGGERGQRKQQQHQLWSVTVH